MIKLRKIGLILGLISLPTLLLAAKPDDETMNWFFVTIGLLGGLSIFLYGMEKMSNGMKKTAGDRLRKILSVLSSNRFVGLLVGAVVTMIIQSSSATTVMLVSFVRSGLMTFGQTLGIILGANIGTTFTAQLIAFKITDYALFMIAIGFLLSFITKKETLKSLGDTILGFGLLFFGMYLMSEAMYPLRSYTPFIELLHELQNPVVSILVGTAFTALIQSSSAFIGIVIVLAQQNMIDLTAGIPMILGANIGTCITAGLAAIGTNREAKRVAIAHTFFKTVGALMFVFWIPYFAEIVEFLSKYTGGGTAREIANAHTIFSVGTALFFLPFTAIIAKLITKILPEKKQDEEVLPVLKYIDNQALTNPILALDLARAEIKTTVKLLNRMLAEIIIPIEEHKITKDSKYQKLDVSEGIKIREKKIDFLEKKLTSYLVEIVKNEIPQKQTNEVFALISVVNYLESIADIINKDIVPLIFKYEKTKSEFSTEGKEDLIKYHEKISKQISRLEEYFAHRNQKQATKIISKWEKYSALDTKLRKTHFLRLETQKKSVETHEIHMELMDNFLQINFLLNKIAKSVSKK